MSLRSPRASWFLSRSIGVIAVTAVTSANADPPERAIETPANEAVTSTTRKAAKQPKDSPEKKTATQTTEPKTLEVVITGTRSPEDAQRSTVRTDIVTRDEAERRGATDVGQALQGQLGVQVNPSAYGFLGNPSAIQIQGFDRERVLILEDGERVVGDVGGAIDLSSIPLTDVSRIEVVTGPTSSLYGTSAIGGVVNVLSGAPEQEGPTAKARIEGRSRRGFVLQGGGTYRKNDTWAGLDLSFQRSDGIALSSELPDLTLPDTALSLVGIRVGTRIGRHIESRIRGRWIHSSSKGLESQVVPGLGTFLSDLPETSNRFTINAVEEIDLGNGVGIRISLGKQWALGETRKDRRNSDAGEIRLRSDNLQSGEFVATLAEGNRTWTLGARGEVERLDQSISKTEPSSGQLETTTKSEVPPTTLGSGALYGQLAWNIGEWLTVLTGVRAEMHLRYGGVVAPRLALALRPSKTLTLRASVGRGFRAPSAKEFGFIFDHSQYGYKVLGNTDLAPETSWGLNGDASWKPQNRLVFRAGGFVNWIQDLIDFQLDRGQASGGVQQYQYNNIGRARTAGFQVDTSWRATKALKVEAGYAYLWTRDDTNLRPLEGRPPHTVYSSMLASLPWKVEFYVRWRSVTDAFIDEFVRSPGSSAFDARIARPLWPASQVYAGVTNILDFQKDPNRLGDQRPIEGRTFYLGLRSEYPWTTE